MKAINEKQILEWKEELSKQAQKLEQAERVVKESKEAILYLNGGIRFGEMLLKKNESVDQALHKEEKEIQSKKAQPNS